MSATAMQINSPATQLATLTALAGNVTITSPPIDDDRVRYEMALDQVAEERKYERTMRPVSDAECAWRVAAMFGGGRA